MDPETPNSKNNQSKMGWRCGSTNEVAALQVQSLEFKPQSRQNTLTHTHNNNNVKIK
jgi:hypothetical protein